VLNDVEGVGIHKCCALNDVRKASLRLSATAELFIRPIYGLKD